LEVLALRILFLGKYPPIQGGVSVANYQTVNDLAFRGCSVDVVTNSSEVESGFREHLWGEDINELERSYGSGGRVRVHATACMAQNSYIPWSNPFASKLFGLGLKVLSESRCDLIVGSYLEPFGFVAALLSHLANRRCILRHAGSDIGRLAKHPDLAVSFQWSVKQASAVLTGSKSSSSYSALQAIGVPSSRLLPVSLSALPPYFRRKGKALSIPDIVSDPGGWHGPAVAPAGLGQEVARLCDKPLLQTRPTIGAYGKVGVTKGSFSLLEALKILAAKGVAFNFVTIASGTPITLAKYYEEIVGNESLADRTWVLPALAPWRIPSFLRLCDIVCFLENRFPIEFHSPRIPREVLAMGRCLVCSNEIVQKQFFRSSLIDPKNILIVDDPTNIQSLVERLRWLVENPHLIHSIGRHGQFLSEVLERELCPSDSIADAVLGSEKLDATGSADEKDQCVEQREST
jgi:glycosyltransferase involved in cell wall biosynthesis